MSPFLVFTLLTFLVFGLWARPHAIELYDTAKKQTKGTRGSRDIQRQVARLFFARLASRHVPTLIYAGFCIFWLLVMILRQPVLGLID